MGKAADASKLGKERWWKLRISMAEAHASKGEKKAQAFRTKILKKGADATAQDWDEASLYKEKVSKYKKRVEELRDVAKNVEKREKEKVKEEKVKTKKKEAKAKEGGKKKRAEIRDKKEKAKKIAVKKAKREKRKKKWEAEAAKEKKYKKKRAADASKLGKERWWKLRISMAEAHASKSEKKAQALRTRILKKGTDATA